MAEQTEKFGRVLVLMGGRSAEREISLQTGNAVLAALLRCGVDAVGIDAGEDVVTQIEAQQSDRVFIALHGRGGEDGIIQGALQSMGIPYTGSGVLGSALSMDKLRTKQIWQAAGLPTPDFRVLTADTDLQSVASQLGFPLIIKPVHEGSSVGMSKVTAVEELHDAFALAARFDDEVIAESWIDGEEYTAAILGEQTLPLIRLETPHAFYDYDAKYKADTTRYHCPCGLEDAKQVQLQILAMQAFTAVVASGWGRVDMMLDHSQQPWLIEVNTVPGMTDHSLVPMAAKAAGIGFDELVCRILETSLVTGK